MNNDCDRDPLRSSDRIGNAIGIPPASKSPSVGSRKRIAIKRLNKECDRDPSPTMLLTTVGATKRVERE